MKWRRGRETSDPGQQDDPLEMREKTYVHHYGHCMRLYASWVLVSTLDEVLKKLRRDMVSCAKIFKCVDGKRDVAAFGCYSVFSSRQIWLLGLSQLSVSRIGFTFLVTPLSLILILFGSNALILSLSGGIPSEFEKI